MNMKTSREPSFILGARAPLFDRLTELDEEANKKPSPHRVLDIGALRNSIARELAQLLNTRTPPGRVMTGTVIDYGLPDFSHFNCSSDTERAQLSQLLANKINQFEPRLKQVRVTLIPQANQPRALVGSIEALLEVDSISEPISFPLLVDPITGQTRFD